MWLRSVHDSWTLGLQQVIGGFPSSMKDGLLGRRVDVDWCPLQLQSWGQTSQNRAVGPGVSSMTSAVFTSHEEAFEGHQGDVCLFLYFCLGSGILKDWIIFLKTHLQQYCKQSAHSELVRMQVSVKSCSISKDEGLWNTAGPPFFTNRCELSQHLLFYLISSLRRLWQDGQTNLTFSIGSVSRAAFPEEPLGPAGDDTQYFVADVKTCGSDSHFIFLKVQKALETVSRSGYQIRMWRCDIKHKNWLHVSTSEASAVLKCTLLTWCFAAEICPLSTCSECSEHLH